MYVRTYVRTVRTYIREHDSGTIHVLGCPWLRTRSRSTCVHSTGNLGHIRCATTMVKHTERPPHMTQSIRRQAGHAAREGTFTDHMPTSKFQSRRTLSFSLNARLSDPRVHTRALDNRASGLTEKPKGHRGTGTAYRNTADFSEPRTHRPYLFFWAPFCPAVTTWPSLRPEEYTNWTFRFFQGKKPAFAIRDKRRLKSSAERWVTILSTWEEMMQQNVFFAGVGGQI